MHILVVKNHDEPTSLEDGLEVWKGGDGDDGLPGSLLNVLAPDLEIATWYPFEIFEHGLTAQTVDERPVWTTVPLNFSGVGGEVETLIEVKQSSAALLMLKAVVQHFKSSGSTSDLWVWIV